MNGLSARMKQPVFHQTSLEQLECQDPDVVALLEVKLQCNGEDRGRILQVSKMRTPGRVSMNRLSTSTKPICLCVTRSTLVLSSCGSAL